MRIFCLLLEIIRQENVVLNSKFFFFNIYYMVLLPRIWVNLAHWLASDRGWCRSLIIRTSFIDWLLNYLHYPIKTKIWLHSLLIKDDIEIKSLKLTWDSLGSYQLCMLQMLLKLNLLTECQLLDFMLHYWGRWWTIILLALCLTFLLKYIINMEIIN